MLVAIGVFTFMSSQPTRRAASPASPSGSACMLLALSHLAGRRRADERNRVAIRSMLTGLAGEPILGFLVAAGITWLVHSSLSVVLLVMSLAAAARFRSRPRAGARPWRQCRRRDRAAIVAVRFAAGRPAACRSATSSCARSLAIAASVRGRSAGRMARSHRSRSRPRDDQFPHRVQSRGRHAFSCRWSISSRQLAERVLPDRPEAVDLGQPRHLDPNVFDYAFGGAGLRHARDAAYGRPRRRHAAAGAGGDRDSPIPS